MGLGLVRLWFVMGKSVYSQTITQDRQCTYTITQIEVSLCNHCRGVESKFIIQSEGVFVALDIQHAIGMRHIACVLLGSTIFLHLISYMTQFPEKKPY
jgi:hypothetical protein